MIADINDREAEESVRSIESTGREGFDLILDSIGGPGFTAHFERLAPFRLVVTYGMLDGLASGDVLGTMQRRPTDSLGLRAFSMHIFDKDRKRRREATEELIQLLAAGKIKPEIADRLPLAEAARAHAMTEKCLGL